MLCDIYNKIDYQQLIDEAMRVLVSKALNLIQNDTLPGNHHFYISFLTNHPDVAISNTLKKQYPKEMTIVLQYQFENLVVESDKFHVVLTFDNQKENITVPYIAMTSFVDPSVNFGLQFTHYTLEAKQDNINAKEKNENIKSPTKTTTNKDTISNVVALDNFRNKH